MPERARSPLRVVAINAAVFLAIVSAVEIAARLVAFVFRGSGTAGLQERTLNVAYEPFVMFGPDWDRRFVDVPHDIVPVVMLVGASTAAGFAPDILEAAVKQRFGRPVRVVNGAFGGYEARQELIVASIWAPSLQPVAIVSLDGHNDLEHRLRVAAPGRFFLDSTYRTYLTHPILTPFAWLLSQSQAYNGLVRLQARATLRDWRAYADAVPVYTAAEHGINIIARGLGATRLMVLQPFVAFKRPLAPEERAFTAYAYREDVMRALYDRTADALSDLARADQVGFLDARGIYDNVSTAIFADDVHFRGEAGYERLARAIAGALPADMLSKQRSW